MRRALTPSRAATVRGQRCVPRRNIGTDVLLNRPQGRSSNSGIVASVFGATGFVGRYLVNRLGRVGSQVVIPFRGEEHGYKHMKVMGDLGQIIPVRVDIRDQSSIERAVSHSNVVINLVGRLRNTTNFTLEEVHVKAAARIAKAARDAGVVRLIHVSDNQASAESASRYAQTKAAGEEAVREAFPDATIVRPCDLYGPEDRFLNRYGIMVRKWPRLAGLLACGPDSRQVQPMWVSDFATALMNIVENDATAGKTFHLGGPRPYTMAQIYELVNRETISETHVRHLPDALLQRLLGYLQYSRKNLFSPEDHILHATDNVVPANAEHTAASLGMNDLATMEKKAIETLRIYRRPFFVNMVDWEAETSKAANERFLPGDKP